MAKTKNDEPRYDKDGNRRVMTKLDYIRDPTGMMALGFIGNIVGQLTYFYTDRVYLAASAVGVVLLIKSVIDACTDVFVGNIVDNMKEGNTKWAKMIKWFMVPTALCLFLLFTVPTGIGNFGQIAYALVTNILLTAVFYTIISTPLQASMTLKTRSNAERTSISVIRSVGNYIPGMICAMATIPVTNMLGGNQNAYIKYGAVIAIIVLLLFFVWYRYVNGIKWIDEIEAEESNSKVVVEQGLPFADAIKKLFKNKYWVITLVFNVVCAVTFAVQNSGGAYYCKWIFGDDNLIAAIGGISFVGTIIGYLLSKPLINFLGTRKTIIVCASAVAGITLVRAFIPDNFTIYMVTSVAANMFQLPMMCLFGVLTSMAIDYNEYKYDNKMVAMSGGAISFGNKVGNGLGSMIVPQFLAMGGYDAAATVATQGVKNSVYAFSNWLPIVLNVILIVLFIGYDLEKKLPDMIKAVQERHAKAAQEQK